MTSKGLHGAITQYLGEIVQVFYLERGGCGGWGRRWLLTLLEPEAQLNLLRWWVLPPQGSDEETSPLAVKRGGLRLDLPAAPTSPNLSHLEKREGEKHAGRRGSSADPDPGKERRGPTFRLPRSRSGRSLHLEDPSPHRRV